MINNDDFNRKEFNIVRDMIVSLLVNKGRFCVVDLRGRSDFSDAQISRFVHHLSRKKEILITRDTKKVGRAKYYVTNYKFEKKGRYDGILKDVEAGQAINKFIYSQSYSSSS